MIHDDDCAGAGAGAGGSEGDDDYHPSLFH